MKAIITILIAIIFLLSIDFVVCLEISILDPVSGPKTIFRSTQSPDPISDPRFRLNSQNPYIATELHSETRFEFRLERRESLVERPQIEVYKDGILDKKDVFTVNPGGVWQSGLDDDSLIYGPIYYCNASDVEVEIQMTVYHAIIKEGFFGSSDTGSTDMKTSDGDGSTSGTTLQARQEPTDGATGDEESITGIGTTVGEGEGESTTEAGTSGTSLISNLDPQAFVNGSLKETVLVWRKKCGSRVPRPGLVLTDVATGKVIYKDGRVNAQWDSEEPTIVFPVKTDVSHFHVDVEEGSQLFSVEEPWADDPLEINYFGSTFRVATDERADKIPMYYSCNSGSGRKHVRMQIKVEPFEPVTFGFIKDCGGANTPRYGLNIVTEVGTHVVTNGTVEKKWGGEYSDNPVAAQVNALWNSPGEQEKIDFFISVDSDSDSESWDKIIFTSSPAAAMSPFVYPEHYENGGEIGSQPTKITVYYNCHQSTSAIIQTIIIIRGYKPIQLTWSKSCVPYVAVEETGGMTANQAMFLFIFIAAAIGIGAGYWINQRRKQRRQTRYRSTPTTEPI